jgi:hypothetical protein
VKKLKRWPNSWGQLRRGLLRSLPVGLGFLGTIDTVEGDAFGVVVVQDFDGVAVEDGDDLAGEVSKDGIC